MTSQRLSELKKTFIIQAINVKGKEIIGFYFSQDERVQRRKLKYTIKKDGTDRPRIKKRVYSNQRLISATKLHIQYIPGTHSTFRTTDKNQKYHYVSFNKKVQDWRCDCWWYANRQAPNKIKYGYCKHILSILFNYSVTKFEMESKKTINIQTFKNK